MSNEIQVITPQAVVDQAENKIKENTLWSEWKRIINSAPTKEDAKKALDAWKSIAISYTTLEMDRINRELLLFAVDSIYNKEIQMIEMKGTIESATPFILVGGVLLLAYLFIRK